VDCIFLRVLGSLAARNSLQPKVMFEKCSKISPSSMRQAAESGLDAETAAAALEQIKSPLMNQLNKHREDDETSNPVINTSET